MFENTGDLTARSELEGKAVKFSFDKERGRYSCTFDASEGDKDWLDALREDLDLRAFLPSGEVAVDGVLERHAVTGPQSQRPQRSGRLTNDRQQHVL